MYNCVYCELCVYVCVVCMHVFMYVCTWFVPKVSVLIFYLIIY